MVGSLITINYRAMRLCASGNTIKDYDGGEKSLVVQLVISDIENIDEFEVSSGKIP